MPCLLAEITLRTVATGPDVGHCRGVPVVTAQLTRACTSPVVVYIRVLHFHLTLCT